MEMKRKLNGKIKNGCWANECVCMLICNCGILRYWAFPCLYVSIIEDLSCDWLWVLPFIFVHVVVWTSVHAFDGTSNSSNDNNDDDGGSSNSSSGGNRSGGLMWMLFSFLFSLSLSLMLMLLFLVLSVYLYSLFHLLFRFIRQSIHSTQLHSMYGMLARAHFTYAQRIHATHSHSLSTTSWMSTCNFHC